MKKGFVAITAVVALAATSLIGSAVAGIGPLRGLPSINMGTLSTQADQYQVTATAVPGAYGSASCVACHTRNPAKRTAYGTAQGKGDLGYAGSHRVTANFGDTSEGGGYADGTAPKARANRLTTPVYMATTAATATWAAAPRYGTSPGANQVGPNDNNPGASAAQMICESCHSIVKNIGAAKLLAPAFANGGDNAAYTVPGTTVLSGIAGTAGGTVVPALCIGCHGRMTSTTSAEYQYHPIGTTTWVGTYHHRNTGTAAYYGGTETTPDNMAFMSTAFYTPAVQMWGANYGELTSATPRALTYNSLSNKKMKAPINTGQIAVANSAGGQVLCTNCHRAHNAATSSGTTILMAYQAATTATTFGPAATNTAANAMLGLATNTRGSWIQNTNLLCLNCHQ